MTKAVSYSAGRPSRWASAHSLVVFVRSPVCRPTDVPADRTWDVACLPAYNADWTMTIIFLTHENLLGNLLRLDRHVVGRSITGARPIICQRRAEWSSPSSSCPCSAVHYQPSPLPAPLLLCSTAVHSVHRMWRHHSMHWPLPTTQPINADY